jgi:hypothetical protein
MTPELHDRIIARLLDSGAVDHPWSDLIVAALEGEECLRAHLDGDPVAKPSPPAGPTGPKFVEPPGAYVSSITVEGFRGVGPAVTLPLRPGPGLTLLARQSLEVALKTYWSAAAPGVEDCSTRAQLLCLGSYVSDEEFARRANQVWTSLSRAAHFHPYELPPTIEELTAWFQAVSEVIEKTEESRK